MEKTRVTVFSEMNGLFIERLDKRVENNFGVLV
jgi:hypothetical protein